MSQGPPRKIPRGAPGRQQSMGALKQAAAQTLKPGQVVFFPTCKKSTKPQAQTAVIRGHGFGVFLGVVPQFAPEPTREMIPQLMAGIGWISFEDVTEFLGVEQFEEIEKKFRAKYEPPPGEEVETPKALPKQIQEAQAPKLIGIDGRPLGEAEN